MTLEEFRTIMSKGVNGLGDGSMRPGITYTYFFAFDPEMSTWIGPFDTFERALQEIAMRYYSYHERYGVEDAQQDGYKVGEIRTSDPEDAERIMDTKGPERDYPVRVQVTDRVAYAHGGGRTMRVARDQSLNGLGGEDMDDIEQRAEQLAWRDTRDSFWEGPMDESDRTNWAATIAQHRDSDPLAVSNYRVISRDLESKFPDDVEEHRFSHWAVGWMDHLFVRIRDDQGNFTPAFLRVIEWEEELENYPVANEEDLGEVEMEMGYDPDTGEWSESIVH